jgi:ferric-dicitrate binding protein FerR (iron transport regulator)
VFGGVRNVELEGEAFFDVVEDPQRPFVVKASELTIRVLGTAFNVKSYPGDPFIATTLVRGKVIVARETSPDKVEENLELKPNEQAVFSHSSEVLTRSQVSAAKYTSWTDGKLVFEDAPVYDVLKSLERWYGVNIHVDDDAGMSCGLTARIDKEPLRETLELLRTTTGVNYSITGNDVFIEGNICGQ